MEFRKICTKVEYLVQAGYDYKEQEMFIPGRIAKSKIIAPGVVKSVSYPKCLVEIPDEVVTDHCIITEIKD